ncbi:MAG TPA: type III-B CRISPR module RAMP protein Cmr4 [Ktedonobacteraceae bacterium]|nr:type III-B CRISPR module RAMP protein Cmr4 [Ktedonobacteraceae bacterium]
MIRATNILYIYTETPLHAGTGSGLSNVDLPIQRERTTQYPMIQGSGIKGKLRAAAEDEQWRDIDVIFGSSRDIKGVAQNGQSSTQSQNGAGPQDNAGALIVGDARILLFPVRSLNGTFAYTTSYDVLQRFARDLERSHIPIKEEEKWSVPSQPVEEPDAEMPTALVTSPSKLTIDVSPASDTAQSSDGSQPGDETIVLEEFSFKAQEDENGQVNKIADWLANHALPQYDTVTYWQEKLKSSLVILPNDEFRDFVLYATEVITRIGIERQTKIVKEGALWTEEHLPTDTLLYVPIYATDSRKKGHPKTAVQVLQRVSELKSSLQLGGDETVGRGFVSTRWGEIQPLQEVKAVSNGNATTTTGGEAAS